MLLSACVNTLEDIAGTSSANNRTRAINKAIAYFNNSRQNTRSNNEIPSNEAPFVAGDIEPDWNQVSTKSKDGKEFSDFHLQKSNRFFLLYGEDNSNEIELYTSFVSVEDCELDTINQYIATYIPDIDYIPHYSSATQDNRLNYIELNDFSGIILFSMISGHQVAAYQFKDGGLTKRAFLYDKSQSVEENINDFYDVMKELSIGVSISHNSTKSDTPNIVIVDPNTNIMYVFTYVGPSSSCIPTYDTPSWDDYQIVEPYLHTLIGGGGGGSSSAKDDTQLDAEIFTKKILKNRLSASDSLALNKIISDLLNDCIGQQLLTKIYDNNLGISIYFDPNHPRSRYYYTEDPAYSKIVMKNNYSEGLLHELFHFYQHYTYGYDTFTQAEVNFEIEAHIASVLHMSLPTNVDAHTRYDNFCNTRWGDRVNECAYYLDLVCNSIASNYEQLHSDIIRNLTEYAFIEAAYFYTRTHSDSKYDNRRNYLESLSDILTFHMNCL